MSETIYPDSKLIKQKILKLSILFSLFFNLLFFLVLVLLEGESMLKVVKIISSHSHEMLFGSSNYLLNGMRRDIIKIAGIFFLNFIFWVVFQFSFLYLSFKKNNIKLVIDDKGILNKFGRFEKFTKWSDFESIKKTAFPMIFKGSKKVYISYFFDLDKVNECIKRNKV